MGRTFSYDYRSSDIFALTLAAGIATHPGRVRVGTRLMTLGAAWAGCVGGIVFGLSIVAAPEVSPLQAVSAAVWGVAGAVVAILLVAPIANRWMLARAYGSKSLEGQSTTIAFSDAGFTRRSQHAEMQMAWAAVDCVIENKGAVFLATGHGVSFIPQRAFESSAACRELVDWVIAQLTPAARARSEAMRRR